LQFLKDLSLLTADVSVAFMNAPVEPDACDLVLLPANITINGCRVIAWLGKAMTGLRRAPLLWFLELQRVVYTMGGISDAGCTTNAGCTSNASDSAFCANNGHVSKSGCTQSSNQG